MKWIVKVTTEMKDGAETETRQIHAGWQVSGRFPEEPPRVDGWSVVLEIASESSDQTHGRMVFPERAGFEFAGSVSQLVRELEKAEGGRAIFAMQGITFWRY